MKIDDPFDEWFEENKHHILGELKVGIEKARWIWQASRQALVVELPAKISHLPHSQVANGIVLPEAEQYDEAIDDCRAAIEAAGLRVKP